MVAYHRVYDGIVCQGVSTEECIIPEVLKSCKIAHSKYITSIEDSKRQKKWMRRAVSDELNVAKKKNKKL